MIVLVMFFAVVSLFVSMLTRRPDVNNNNLHQVEGVRQVTQRLALLIGYFY